MNLEKETDRRQRLIREGKRVEETGPENIELILKIFQGFTIDERNFTQPDNDPGYYGVKVWTVEGEYEYTTKVVQSYGGYHTFNEKLVIRLDSPADRYLYVELLRGLSWKDPGTSHGTGVIGRAKIKLPPRTSCLEFRSKIDLVDLNSDRGVVFKGHLTLSMKVHKYVTS